MTQFLPNKLVFYYGYPSLVNGASGNITAATAVFSIYDQVIFGDGLQNESHSDHANTIAIIGGLTTTDVYGYVDTTVDLDILQTNIDNWYTMGVKGIFCDKFGYDYGNTRVKQRELVWSIHEKGTGLKAFINAWNPDDAFTSTVVPIYNPAGLNTRLGANDWYLAESFAIANGIYDDTVDGSGIRNFQAKATQLISYRTTYGTKLAAVTTCDASGTFNQNMCDFSYSLATINGFDSWGWGELFYAALNCNIPFRNRLIVDGTKFINSINFIGNTYQRNTNIGLNIDVVGHTITNLTS